jgi:phosphate transport system permease protein
MLITSPIGIAGGIYISEFSSPRISAVCDTVLDILLGVPSIIAGLFAYLVLVPVTGFSGLAGSLSLGILTLPIVMRTTREVLRLVPPSIREASLALGIPIWRTTILVTLRTALPGVLTGLVLASSRSLGETAPLIMTAQGTNALNILDFGTTMNAMPLVIFRYARSPDQLQIGQAWAAALILMTIALVMNVIVRRKTVDSRVA